MPFINKSPLNYPANAHNPIRTFQDDRPPTVNDFKNFIVTDEWLDTSSNDFYKMVFKDSTQGVWAMMAGTGGAVESFIPDGGTSPVVPNVANQITFTGGNGIVTTGGLNTMDWAMQSPFVGSFVFENNTAATILSLVIDNNDADPGSYASLGVTSEPLGGDAFVVWQIAATQFYSFGIDNSDGDNLKLTDNVDPSTGNVLFQITPAGVPTFPTAPLDVPSGGTGVNAITDGALIVGSGAATITEVGPLTDGQLVIGSTGADPVAASLASAGATIAITNGAGTINLETGPTIADTYTTDAGNAIPALGVLNILGGNSVTTSGAGNTVTVTNLADVTRYVVDAVAGETAYQTIQAAMNAANAAGGGEIVVRGGTYTEDLTCFPDITVTGPGITSGYPGGATSLVIVGNHVPAATGIMTFNNVTFTTAVGDTFTSAAAGTAELNFTNSGCGVTNGYFLNVPNWTGVLSFWDFNPSLGTNDGGINNQTGGASIYCYEAGIGIGNGNTMQISGTMIFNQGEIFCPIQLNTGTIATFLNDEFGDTISIAGTASVSMSNCLIATGANTAITHNSTSDLTISTSSIDSSNNPAVGGTGTIDVTGVDFIDNALFAGTLTITGGKSVAATARLLDRTDNAIAVYSAGGEVDELGPLTNGQLVIGSTGAAPAAASLTSTGETLTITEGAGTLNIDTNASLQTDTGFAAWDAAGPYFDDTTLGEFELLVAGSGYIHNVLVTWTAPQTVVGMVAGNTYEIYIDDTGTIQKIDNRLSATYLNNIVLFQCLRDSTVAGNNQVTTKENHPYNFPVRTSNYLHNIVGTVIENINNGANITLNGTKKIQINGADELDDHGLETDIPDSGGVAVSWVKMFTLATGKWARQNFNDTFSGYWNNGGVPELLGASKYGIYRLFATKDNLNITTPVYGAILDNSQYNNLAAAETAIANGTTSDISGEILGLEPAQLGYIIFKQSTDEIIEVIIDKTTLRSSTSSSGTNTAALVTTDVASFNGWLSAADTNVQAALNTLDDVGLGVTAEHALLVAGAGYTIGSLGPLTNGQILIGSTGAAAVPATITAGVGINIANAAGAITISTGGGGFSWTEVVGVGPTAMTVNNGYIANNAAQVGLTLPAVAAIGDSVQILGKGAGGWQIQQGAGQQIHFNNLSTTLGAGGTLSSNQRYNCVELICITANVAFVVNDASGNLVVV